jgi:hypothetical protein
MRSTYLVSTALLAAVLGAAGCSSDTADASPAAGADRSGHYRAYGVPVRVGEGHARTYVTYDLNDGDAPVEIGIALDERAMDGLPAPNPHAAGHAKAGEHEHLDSHVYLLSLPHDVAPFRFVELDWNPGGHEPPGVYDEPHFDFHFWTATREARESIVPSDPQFQRRADMLPAETERPEHFAVAAPPGAPTPGVPLMGVHWADMRAPELQKMVGNPAAWRPFTTTFLYGSWEGRWVFLEPMITRSYILAKKTATDPAVRDEVIPIPAPRAVAEPGHYPAAYRIAWDSQSREYRIALTDLRRRD